MEEDMLHQKKEKGKEEGRKITGKESIRKEEEDKENVMDMKKRVKEEEEEEEFQREEVFMLPSSCVNDDAAPTIESKECSVVGRGTANTTGTYEKGGWGARHTLVLLASVGVILMGMMRYSLSIAIVSMVTPSATVHHHQHPEATPPPTPAPPPILQRQHHQEFTNIPLSNFTTTPSSPLSSPTHSGFQEYVGDSSGGGGGGVCPAPEGVDGGVNDTVNGVFNDSITRFDWDEKTQGHVLGAFYYGYFLTNILGGRLAERIGSKPVILVGMFLSSLLSLLSPLAAHLSTGVFIGVRLVQGLAQGVLLPAFNRCLVMWVPPFKRSKYNTFVFIGTEAGIVLSLALGGYLCSQPSLGGWAAVFHAFGGAGVLWCVVWWVVVRESPMQHSGMSAGERQYLVAHCVVRKEQVSVAWGRVLRSLPFWALTVMHVGYNWGYYTIVSELPVYLANMQHLSIRNNGFVSALPYIAEVTFALLFSIAVDRASAKGRLSVLAVRRLAMAVASYIPAAALVGMCLVGCDSVAAVVVVCVAVGAGGSAFCGLFCSHQDLSPQLAGTLLGVTNSIANVTGFLAPALVGVITYNNQTVWAWNTVFLLCAAIYLVSATFYITCITDQVQPFNCPIHKKEEHVVEVKVEKPSGGTCTKQLPVY